MTKSRKKKTAAEQRTEWAIEARRNPTAYETMLHSALLIVFEPWDVTLSVQEEIGMYRADFIIYPERIVVEVDGRGHDELKQAKRDQIRETYMRNLGIRTLRFTNHEVFTDAAACAQAVVKACSTLRPKREGKVKITHCPPGVSGHFKQKKYKYRVRLGLL